MCCGGKEEQLLPNHGGHLWMGWKEAAPKTRAGESQRWGLPAVVVGKGWGTQTSCSQRCVIPDAGAEGAGGLPRHVGLGGWQGVLLDVSALQGNS